MSYGNEIVDKRLMSMIIVYEKETTMKDDLCGQKDYYHIIYLLAS